MIYVTKVCYRMKLGPKDIWSLYGHVMNHPIHGCSKLFISRPVDLDEEKDEIITCTGKQYKFLDFESKREKVIEQIKKDIENGCYENY